MKMSKDMQKEILLESFEVLKTDYQENHREISETIGKMAAFDINTAMDMWEHAFVTDYGATAAGRAEYLQAYFKNLDWETSGQRLADALQGKMSSRAKN